MPEETPREGRGVLERALGAGEVLVSAHAAVASREAKDDLARVVSGVVLLAIAALLFSTSLVLLQVLAVFEVHARAHLGWGGAILAVSVGDAVTALLLVAAARARLRRPILVETRATLTRLVAALRG
jgi:hypothetical protein